jgi:hypothetical protein
MYFEVITSDHSVSSRDQHPEAFRWANIQQ